MGGRGRYAFKINILFIVLLVVSVGVLIARESVVKRPKKLYMTTSGTVDMCLSCHTTEKLDPAHDPKVIGCASCHLGDAMAITKEEAHKGMVLNPGDLRHAGRTCASEGCHPADIHKVKNSLMATNRGIIGTLLYYWGESKSQNTDLTVRKLMKSGRTSLALDYYRKLCATCHLWKQQNDLPGAPAFFNAKGGGCAACHVQYPGDKRTAKDVLTVDGRLSTRKKGQVHPLLSKKVSDTHCIRCHNRSGRIGLSFLGIFESEGYGTPYKEGALNSKQLPGGSSYLDLPDDVHHRKDMQCIDCHTRDEIMGNGTSYAHYEKQLEISCTTCHSTTPGTTRKGHLLNNLEKKNGKIELVGKVSGKTWPLKPFKPGVCDFAPHKRLSCAACHSTWVPQCYGCHIKNDRRKTHLDKLSLKQTKGQWQEGRSYLRYEKPMLGLWANKVVVVTPGCQDMLTVVDDQGNADGGFNRFTMAAINPHTIQEKGRTCVDCHASTKTVGLGKGTIALKNGKLQFTPIGWGEETNHGRTVPLDAYVSIDGKPLQHSSRPDMRPFNREELGKILRVGLCVGCHNTYADPLWKSYTSGMKCPRKNKNDLGIAVKTK